MIRGWCPGVHEPMPTGDGLLARVKPPDGRLAGAAARTLARAAARFGNGVIELTGRGNIQVRGLDAAGAPHFAAAMVAAGLASADPAIERRRNVFVSPLAGDDPTVASNALALAAAIEAMLASEQALAALPGKFAFAVDGGGVLPLSVPADIAVRSDGAGRWTVMAGSGTAMTEAGSADVTVARVRDLALAAGGRRLRGRDLGAGPPTPVGFIAYPGAGRGAFGLGLPFGQADAATLERLADLAERFGDGVLRVSPWRAVLLGGVQARDAAALRMTDLIVDPADRRLSMAACVGSLGCASGTVRAREDAAVLADAGWRGFLHVSGCAKGCAHPGAAANTLVGEDGRYRLVRDGRVEAVGLSVQQAAACLA